MTVSTMERPLRATLYELGLQSENVATMRAFYRTTLGYHFDESGLGTARDRRVTIMPGQSKYLAYAAYAVPDEGELDALKRRLSANGTSYETASMPGFTGKAVRFADPDGNQFRFGLAMTPMWDGDDPVADRVARLQHVVFASTDVQQMLSFFTDVVGFQLTDRVEDDDNGLRTFFVRCSHEHHNLAVFAANECRLDHHCYEAGDWGLIRDWADHVSKHRIPLKWGPGRHGPGNNLFVFIHDPDGNWLEISAELENVEHDRPVGTWPHEEYTLNSWGMGLLRS